MLLPGGRRPLRVCQRGGWRRRAAGHGRALRADRGGGPRDGGLRAGGHPGGRAGRGPQNKGVAAREPRGTPGVMGRAGGRGRDQAWSPAAFRGATSVLGAGGTGAAAGPPARPCCRSRGSPAPCSTAAPGPQVSHPHLQPASLLLHRLYTGPVWFPHFQSS